MPEGVHLAFQLGEVLAAGLEVEAQGVCVLLGGCRFAVGHRSSRPAGAFFPEKRVRAVHLQSTRTGGRGVRVVFTGFMSFTGFAIFTGFTGFTVFMIFMTFKR
jgi:hypothetical protein